MFCGTTAQGPTQCLAATHPGLHPAKTPTRSWGTLCEALFACDMEPAAMGRVELVEEGVDTSNRERSKRSRGSPVLDADELVEDGAAGSDGEKSRRSSNDGAGPEEEDAEGFEGMGPDGPVLRAGDDEWAEEDDAVLVEDDVEVFNDRKSKNASLRTSSFGVVIFGPGSRRGRPHRVWPGCFRPETDLVAQAFCAPLRFRETSSSSPTRAWRIA